MNRGVKLPIIVQILVLLVCTCSPLRAEEDKPSHPITAWPLIYSSEEGETAETDVLWPLYRHERRGTWEKYALRPLLFNYVSDPSEDQKEVSVLWPLNVYKHKKDELSLNLTLYLHKNAPDRRSTIFLPVYWNGSGKDYSYFHIWPLFGVNHDKTYTEHSTLYPFFRYGKDPQKDALDVHLFWPVVNYSSAPGYFSRNVLPLYWQEEGPDTSGGFVFPYYWKKSSAFQADGIFPLWYSSHGPAVSTDVVLPVYFNHETSDTKLRLMLPFYGSWKKGGDSLTAITPLYFDYEREDLRLRAGLPLYWNYRNGPFSFTTLFPMYFHTEDSRLASEFTSYFPVYGSYRRGEAYTRHFLLTPFYSHYRDESNGFSGWDVMWPLFNYETGQDRQSLRILPLLWFMTAPDRELSIGFPFYFSYKNPEGSYLHFLPIYGQHTKGNHFRQRFILGPAYIDTEESAPGDPYLRKDILFPLYSSLRESDRERSWLFPFYYRNETPGRSLALGSALLLPPYYINYHEDRSDVFHVWPFYSSIHKEGYREYGTLWPFIRFGKDSEAGLSLTQLLAFYRKSRPDRAQTFLFPLWFHTASANGVSDYTILLHSYESDQATHRTRLSLFWLGNDLAVFTYRKEQDQTLACRFLWKVVSYERTAPDTEEFRFLWRLVRKSTGPDEDILELNPFYYSEKSKDNTSYRAILGGLVGFETLPDGTGRMRYLWGL